MTDEMSKNATIDPNPKIIRIYMNTWKDVLNFTKMIRPVCSKVKYPAYILWLSGFDPVMITIKWDSVVHRYDIYRNIHIENKEWKGVKNR